MVANVETMAWVGNRNRDVPWHGLGTYVGEAPILAEEAIEAGGLNWEVEKRQLFTPAGDSFAPVKDFYATVRTSDDRPLGVVKSGYEVIQNKAAFNFMDELVGPGRLARYNTVGSLAGGRRIWLLAEVQDLFEAVPGDEVKRFLLLANSHDGSLELKILWTSVRVVCQNTLRMALGKAGAKVTIRHTASMQERMAQAQVILGLDEKVSAEFKAQVAALTRKQIGTKLWEEILNDLVPLPEDDVSPTRAENKRAQLTALFESGTGTDIPGVAGTGWAAVNAFSEYSTWGASTRTRKGDSKEEARLNSNFFGDAGNFSAKALAKVLELV